MSKKNPYYSPASKPEKNPDHFIIPAWALSSFFDDYGITEIELLRDKNPDVLRLIMLKNGKQLNL